MKVKQLLLLVTIVLFSCKQTPKQEEGGFVLKGQLVGMTSCSVIVKDFKNEKTDTIKIFNGTVTITGNYPEPTMLNLIIENVTSLLPVFAENEKFELKGDRNKPNAIVKCVIIKF